MDSSIPVLEKPLPRLSVLDWTRNIQRLQNDARLHRYQGYELRQRANQLRNETAVTTRWDTYVNNELMRDRIFEVQSWRDKQRYTLECVRDETRALREEKHASELLLESLQLPLMVVAQCLGNQNQRELIFEVQSWREKQRYTLECVRDETRALREEKHATELLLESLQLPLMVVAQCLGNREQRVPPELTRDQLGEELKRELHIIENSKRVLTDVCHMGWQKIKDLENVACRLAREIQNKDDALQLDYHVKDLDRDSADISYKLDPTRIPQDSISEDTYVHCIENTITIAEQLMQESKQLRETMFRSRETATNQMYAQSQQVEMVMRRRMYDIQRARNEMDWQKYKLETNLSKLEREIDTLRAAVADKIAPTKLVETRLETRTRRPVLERVQDKPMRGLIEEFERVHLSTNMLENKLEEALTTYHSMQSHYQRVVKDLQYKNQALETDRRLVEIRKPLHSDNGSQFARNVGYCRMADELLGD